MSPHSRPAASDAPAFDRERMLARGGNNFNFLRLILATLVLLSHSFELVDGDRAREPLSLLFHTLSFGELAVDGFFLLSGFLIVRSWQQSPQLWSYFKKRFLRIYPGFVVAFWISLLLVGALGSLSPVSEYLRGINFPRQLFLLSFLLAPGATDVFAGQPFVALNGPMWTISYEFRCYILVAILGMLGAVRNRFLWMGATLLVMLIYALRLAAGDFGFLGSFYLLGMPDALVRLTMFFLAGGCFFLFLDNIRFKNLTALIFLPIVFLSMFSAKFGEVALATFGAYLLFWFAFLEIPALNRFKHHSDVSYGLYLYGWPVQKLLLWYIPALSPYLLFPLSLLISYGCGYASWTFIEKPALKLKRRTPKDPRIVSA